ncbi:FxLYD domain-containing protein [Halomarina rubra]|uniref:FxLYD domain-containing protein n=1 Tax=Halomarina rubra TaxID=2071873 RepID=A0ABD6AYJ0_9EURY|nr:FxLYD domain-containing protein [Halomarina rubra]
MSESGANDGQLPPLIDVRDTLDDVEREANRDVSEEVDAIRANLDRLATRDGGGTVVDDIEDDVLALRERLSGDADWYAEAVENRVRQYRTARRTASDTLDVADPRLTRNGTAVDLDRQRGDLVEVEGVLVNQGEDRSATLQVVFYDEDGTVARKVESRAYDLASGDRRDVSFTVYVPDDASYHDVAAVDASDPRSIDGDEPTPDDLERERRREDDEETGRNESGERSAEENAGDA